MQADEEGRLVTVVPACLQPPTQPSAPRTKIRNILEMYRKRIKHVGIIHVNIRQILETHKKAVLKLVQEAGKTMEMVAKTHTQQSK